MFGLCNFLTTLAVTLAAGCAITQQADAAPINWRHSLDAAKLEANQSGKLVLLHFYTPSCGPCKKLERDVFSQPQIATAVMQNYIPVKLNADESPALANAYQVKRVPFEVVLNPQGNVVQTLNCPLEPNAYGSQLVNVAQHYHASSAVRPASAQAPVNSAYAGLKIGQAGSQPTSPQQAVAVQPQVTTNPYFSSPTETATTPTATRVEQQPITPTTAPGPVYRSRYGQSNVPATAQGQPVTTQPTTSQPVAPQTAIAKAPAQSTRPEPRPEASAIASAAVAATKQTLPNEAKPKGEVWPPKLPSGTPPLAFDGYCPVSLREAKKWVRGKTDLGAIHRGRTYLFSSEAQRQKFLASTSASDSYSPVFSGNDPVKLLDDNEQVVGQRKYGFEYRNAFYLFSSKETMERFARQPDRYSAGVRQAMTRMDAAANGTVLR